MKQMRGPQNVEHHPTQLGSNNSTLNTTLGVAGGILLALVILWATVSCKAEVRIQPQSCIYNSYTNTATCKAQQ